MKKSIKLLLSAGMVVLAASCVKENIRHEQSEAQTGAMVTETIVARVDEGDTKATINDSGVFCWAAGDNIAVHVSDGGTPKYVKTTTGPSENSASASFTVSYPVGSTRDAFAIYPSSIVSETDEYYGGTNVSDYALRVKLPATYTLSEVSGENSPCPMIADNTGSDWSFKQICGVLRLTVSGIPADATGLVIQFLGRKVNGDFYINSPVVPGTSVITNQTPNTNNGEDRITVTFAAGTATSMTLNIPLPVGSYADVTVAPVGSSSTIAAIKSIKEGGYTAARAHGKKLSVTMTAVSTTFSVSASKKVIFAPGNLQYTRTSTSAAWSTGTWSFMVNQYDMIETDSNPYCSNGYADKTAIGLFGFGSWVSGTWTTDPNTPRNAPNNTAVDDSLYPNFADDFNGTIYNLGWRTLTENEWNYLLQTRTGGDRYAMATINTDGTAVKGLIIFPDGYTHGPVAGVTWADPLHGANNFATQCTIAGWTALEAAGCVFLPAAGIRNGGTVSNVMQEVAYWSKSPYDAEKGYYLEATSTYYHSEQTGDRYLGRSVRLVHDVN